MEGWDNLEMDLERRWREVREGSEKGVIVVMEKEWSGGLSSPLFGGREKNWN